MNPETQDFLAEVTVTEWEGLYAEDLLARFFGVVSGLGELLS